MIFTGLSRKGFYPGRRQNRIGSGLRCPFRRGCSYPCLIDALLGAASLGDIGTHFPPSEERWKNADSRDLLNSVLSLLREKGWSPINIDSTVILEKPRLRPYIDDIRNSLARLTGLPEECISVKAKTKEKQGCGRRRPGRRSPGNHTHYKGPIGITGTGSWESSRKP